MARKKAEVAAPEAPAHRQCAYAGCMVDAEIATKRPTGWANVCRGHYAMLMLADAKAYTAALGLQTPAEMRAWIKGRDIGKGRMHGAFLANYKPSPLRNREPGDDDEEICAA